MGVIRKRRVTILRAPRTHPNRARNHRVLRLRRHVLATVEDEAVGQTGAATRPAIHDDAADVVAWRASGGVWLSCVVELGVSGARLLENADDGGSPCDQPPQGTYLSF